MPIQNNYKSLQLNDNINSSSLNSEHLTLNAKSNLSPELLFLITCCQTNPSKDDINFIHSYLNTSLQSDDTNTIHYAPSGNALGVRLSTITSMANSHGVLPLIYKTIKKLNASSKSDSLRSSLNPEHLTLNAFLSKLKIQYMIIAQRNILMSAELIRIIQLLEKNSIESLAFKGPALSQMAYGDITLRQYVDLDVLTRKEDIYKIDTLLKDRGYQRVLEITPTQEKVYIDYAHDLGLYHPKSGVHFEMHWSFLDEDYPMQVDLKDFWKDTQTVKINGHEIPTFSNENLLYYLCIHGSKHLWERIEWIKDLDLMIRNETIDWDALIAKAEGSGFEKMVYLGFSLSTSLFATPLPQIIHDQIAKHQQLNTLSEFVVENWQTPKSTFEKTSAMLKLFPGIKEQVIYLHKIILKPSFNEYWFIDLPKGFYWGYYLVRPYLLIKKILLKVKFLILNA